MTAAMLVLVLCVLLAPGVYVDAQPVTVHLVGAVQWIGGLGMALALDAGGSVRVDLTTVDQATYQGLTTGDRIVVTGVLSPRRDRVIATAITLATASAR